MHSCYAFALPFPVTVLPTTPHRNTRPIVTCTAKSGTPPQPSTLPPPPPPKSVDDTLELAAQSLSNTLATGTKRVALSAIIPGLNPLIEDTVPYSDALLNTVAYSLALSCPAFSTKPSIHLLFKSAGTAAAAYASLQPPEDSPLTFASYYRRDGGSGGALRASPHANIVVNPTSARGDRIMEDLETIIAEAPDAVWVLLNPDFGRDRAAVGIHESSRRDMFLKSFTNAFYFRNLFEIRRPQLIPVERGALLYTHPGPWHVFALASGSYVEAEDFNEMPTADEITRCVRTVVASVTAPTRKANLEAGEEEYLQVLGLCAAAFAAVYVALGFLQHT